MDLLNIFEPWLNEDTSEEGLTTLELSLRPDSPLEAIQAYTEYYEIEKNAELQGVKI